MICIWLTLIPDILQLANRAPGTKILIKVLHNVQPSDETKGEKKMEKKVYHLENNSLKTLNTIACIWNLIVTSGCLFYYGGK